MLSYFILKSFSKFDADKKIKLDPVKNQVLEYMKSSNEIPIISMKITSYDYKKDFVNLIIETRTDWQMVLTELLFETPIRIHKYIVNNLIQAHAYKSVNSFIDRAISGAKASPEIFLWVAKNLLTRTWDYEWLDYPRERLILSYFRVMQELKKSEMKGNRLKNIAVEFLFDNDEAVLRDIVAATDEVLIGKLFDMARGISYLEKNSIDKMYSIIREKYTAFAAEAQNGSGEGDMFDEEKLIVSPQGFERMSQELNRMVNIEMAQLSAELAKLANINGDSRENVDYNSLMEKQNTLKMNITNLDSEIKRAQIIDPKAIADDVVGIGTKVMLAEPSGEIAVYQILGPWDADFEKGILSYRSPVAKALIGKKAGDEVSLKAGDTDHRYTVRSIEKFSN